VQRIFFQQSQTPPRLVVIAGIDRGDGSSRVAASIAEALAANATRGVCMVEANFRAPAFLGTPKPTSAHGLTTALREEGPIWSFVKPTGNERVWLLATGPLDADSPNLFNSVGMRSRCSELRAEFDFVIVDAPPLGRYADAIALAQLSDGIILILEAEETRREAAIAVVDDLRSSHIAILGAVLNQRTYPIPEPIYRRL
jgi:Mrp family chromosome partitioning ATPase